MKITNALCLVVLLTGVGCNKVNHLTGVEKKSDDTKPSFYVVSCCQDNHNGVMSYPAFVPESHVQLCTAVKQAGQVNEGRYNGGVYLAMNVDCGQGFGHIGDEYYVGKGY
jgi:hypothetical protein